MKSLLRIYLISTVYKETEKLGSCHVKFFLITVLMSNILKYFTSSSWVTKYLVFRLTPGFSNSPYKFQCKSKSPTVLFWNQRSQDQIPRSMMRLTSDVYIVVGRPTKEETLLIQNDFVSSTSLNVPKRGCVLPESDNTKTSNPKQPINHKKTEK